MKKFIGKNLGYIILAMMLIGMAVLGFGLDWDQSQIKWKADAATSLIVTGSVLFAGGILLLVTNSNTRSGD
jgi:uncharacterized membrane protein YgdD (TMEM256/DUF423 family)